MVSKLYEEIDVFENTTVENIINGLRTGRGYCIEVNKKVVAMAKSTLETRTHAMIVGVGTHPNFRNKGLATKCIVKICSEIINENKELITANAGEEIDVKYVLLLNILAVQLF